MLPSHALRDAVRALAELGPQPPAATAPLRTTDDVYERIGVWGVAGMLVAGGASPPIKLAVTVSTGVTMRNGDGATNRTTVPRRMMLTILGERSVLACGTEVATLASGSRILTNDVGRLLVPDNERATATTLRRLADVCIAEKPLAWAGLLADCVGTSNARQQRWAHRAQCAVEALSRATGGEAFRRGSAIAQALQLPGWVWHSGLEAQRAAGARVPWHL